MSRLPLLKFHNAWASLDDPRWDGESRVIADGFDIPTQAKTTLKGPEQLTHYSILGGDLNLYALAAVEIHDRKDFARFGDDILINVKSVMMTLGAERTTLAV